MTSIPSERILISRDRPGTYLELLPEEWLTLIRRTTRRERHRRGGRRRYCNFWDSRLPAPLERRIHHWWRMLLGSHDMHVRMVVVMWELLLLRPVRSVRLFSGVGRMSSKFVCDQMVPQLTMDPTDPTDAMDAPDPPDEPDE